jgi:hypothetical protein
MKLFSEHPGDAQRALQAWGVLIGMAMRRETTTYKLLSEKMFGREAAGVLAGILGHIQNYCQQHGLPPLNVLVVQQDSGRGEGSRRRAGERLQLRLV